MYDPNATPLDLRFRLFGTDVRVSPWFWLGSALLGWNETQQAATGNQLGDLAVWIGCVFFSILLHEFGHVWMGRAFGSRGYILLHGMGGLAIGSADVPYRWQRILVSAAGPGIQLLFFAGLLVLLRARVLPSLPPVVGLAISKLIVINLFWPLLNLLPIWPLDGGWITRDVCGMASERNGLLVSLWISFVTAALLAVNAFMWWYSPDTMERLEASLGGRDTWPGWLFSYLQIFNSVYMAIFFALFAVGSFQAMQESNARRRRYWDDEGDDRKPWER